MATYSIYEAKSRFSEVIRRVKNGESVTITERGKPTATITQIEAKETQKERWQRLIAQGIIIPAKKPFKVQRTGLNMDGAIERFLADRNRDL
jgi:prevent-host-death family protein